MRPQESSCGGITGSSCARCELASYTRDVHSGVEGPRALYLCVGQERQSVSFLLTEFITSSWSAPGDSLRHDLEDTLRARFGDRVSKNN
jgi:hypothetical protein